MHHPDRSSGRSQAAIGSGGVGAARAALRAATAARHRRLHGQRHFAALAGGRLDRDGYLDLLIRLRGFYRPFESAVFGSADVPTPLFGVALGQRRRLPLLDADLRSLGMSAATIARIDDCERLPPADRPAERLGCLYVTEGSTLGGALLAERAGALFCEPGTDGRRFFLAYGTENGQFWRECCAGIERCAVAAPGHLSEMLNGATATFEILDDWLSR